MIEVLLKRLPHGADLPLPGYATAGAAGMDICAAVTDQMVLAPGARALIPTGFAIALPPDYELQIRPRSGLALKSGIMVVNSPGTIDADYRGEVQILLLNAGAEPFVVTRGMRIAQAVLAPVYRAVWRESETLEASGRGAGGFGSTGLGFVPPMGG
jgi:deoxyuridine 5'-triphosphate nucleotidohydrolase